MKNAKDKNMLITYDCQTGNFTYPDDIRESFSGQFDDRPLWQIMKEEGMVSEGVAEELRLKLEELASADTPQVHFTESYIKTDSQNGKWYRIGFVCPVPGKTISITTTEMTYDEVAMIHQIPISDYDKLTGLLNRNAFTSAVETILQADKENVAAGEYALLYFDVIRFKAVNDMFGMEKGDSLLKYIAETITKLVSEDAAVSRLNSDRFAVFTQVSGSELLSLVERLLESIAYYDLPFKITCNVGIYVTTEEQLSVDAMIDRAVLAQSSIKGSYTSQYNVYTEALRKDMLGEQEISGIMTAALAENQFVLYYQPQYNHATGMLVGAEALVRWIHPERGMISPGVFIPIFEKNGFITKLDLYVFEQACAFVRRCMDAKLPMVPVSTNFSRYDIFQQDFVEKLEQLRKKYKVPTKYLRVEITESAVVGGSKHANEIVKKLHDCGYIVEMDDFGSGYSSLNVLKDIDLDIIKLDMLFLSDDSETKRGGTILSSVVRMAKRLDMPVIAEGVETMEQADFLRSIGCEFIQGYLYSRPLPEEQYVELLRESKVGSKASQMKLVGSLRPYNFWDPQSHEALIFSKYVSGAAIFEYREGHVDILRVNQKYLQELGMNLSEKDVIDDDPLRFFDEENQRIYADMLKRAVETEEEQECETWRTISSACCGEDTICIRTNVRLLGKGENNYLFYAMIRNVTAEKRHYEEIEANEKRFKFASEQANIYFWEYNVATKEMRPCFRCMRDLGLPPLLTNYPESAIEAGVFPPEVADMYRDWHVQIANGVKELEAVIPLTMDRVPFRVKYTTEFDEHGNPVKAYGSATLIVNTAEE